MRIRMCGVAALAAMLLPVGLVEVTPASAATTAPPHYVVVTGDTGFLVYAEAAAHGALDPTDLGSGVNLYALGRSGKPVLLGKAGRQPLLMSLSGSNFIMVNPYLHHKRIRWFNLGAGTHGMLATNENIVGATPDGWISEDGGYNDGTHVVARSESGGIVDYGNPITPGVDYAVTVGPSGFVAYADAFPSDNGEITYTPWGSPGRHRTLVSPGGKNNHCDDVSASYAACILNSGAKQSIALVGVNGSSRAVGNGTCAFRITVWGTSLAWTIGATPRGCDSQHLGDMSITGTTRLSNLRFDPHGVASAWGRLVTSSRGQGSLVTLTGIHGKPTPLRRALV